jgi:hypothetical protein
MTERLPGPLRVALALPNGQVGVKDLFAGLPTGTTFLANRVSSRKDDGMKD